MHCGGPGNQLLFASSFRFFTVWVVSVNPRIMHLHAVVFWSIGTPREDGESTESFVVICPTPADLGSVIANESLQFVPAASGLHPTGLKAGG